MTVAADGSEQRREVTTIPLDASGAGMAAPAVTDIGEPRDGALPVGVRPAQPPAIAAVQAQVYPQHVFGGGNDGTWQDLQTTDGRAWSGAVDVGTLPPGLHRLQVRMTGSDGSWSEVTRAFDIARGAQDPREQWRSRLTGSVQGALAASGDLVVAGSTGGEIEAFRLGPSPQADEHAAAANPAPRPAWRAKLGAVPRSPAMAGRC